MKIHIMSLMEVLSTISLVAQTVTTLSQSGSLDDRINVVYLAEGFTADESDQFLARVRELDRVLRTDESWERFTDWMNSYAIMVAGAESGADIPNEGVVRDTYFNTSFGEGSQDRFLAISGSRAGVNELLISTIPAYDIVVLLVNSPKYGGTGGFPATISNHEDAAEILLHELGHSFAILADEHVVSDQQEIKLPAFNRTNSSLGFEWENLSWRDFVAPETGLPTVLSAGTMLPDENFVGAFEGAVYWSNDIYRPTNNSKMRSLNRPFGPVNLKAFADQVHLLNLGSPSLAPRITKQPVSLITELGESGGAGCRSFQ